MVAGRIITANYRNITEDFFGGASSKWQGSEQNKGAVVKLREMWRRTPLHYHWVNKGGGQWVIKNPPCAVIADIDTTEPDLWKQKVEKCANNSSRDKPKNQFVQFLLKRHRSRKGRFSFDILALARFCFESPHLASMQT